MRVGVDGRSLVGGARGVAQYTRALLGELAARFPGDEWRVLLPAGDAAVPAGVEEVRSPRRSRVLHGAGALLGRPRVDELLAPVDVLWMPAPGPVGRGPGVPLVLTLHDLSWEERPGDFTAYERLWHRLARPASLAREARRVMADSVATRDQALARWDLEPGRIGVVAPGVTRPVTAQPPVTGAPYVLWVGALEPRKAPDVLAAALERLDGLELRVAGAGRLAGVLAPRAVELGVTSSARLDALYRGAVAVACPSWLEGFGFVPLEAALRDCPAVVSDLPVFRETLGPDGAVFVAPGDPSALREALRRLAGDPDHRARVAKRARTAAERFTWAAAADAAHRMLREAAGP